PLVGPVEGASSGLEVGVSSSRSSDRVGGAESEGGEAGVTETPPLAVLQNRDSRNRIEEVTRGENLPECRVSEGSISLIQASNGLALFEIVGVNGMVPLGEI